MRKDSEEGGCSNTVHEYKEEKPFQCSYCERRFKTKQKIDIRPGTLTKHEHTNTGRMALSVQFDVICKGRRFHVSLPGSTHEGEWPSSPMIVRKCLGCNVLQLEETLKRTHRNNLEHILI